MGACLSLNHTTNNKSRDAACDRELYNIRNKLNTVSRLHSNAIAELKREMATRDATRDAERDRMQVVQ